MKFYTIAILLLTLSSCGNSQKDAEAEKKIIADSVKSAVLKQIDNEKEEKERLEKEKQFEEEKNNKITEIGTQIENLQSELITEKAKLIDISKPKFLRSAAERDNAIRNQENIINGIESSLEELRTSISNIQQIESNPKQFKVEILIGCWFIPHSASINIKFDRNGRFKFNDYNNNASNETEILRGNWQLNNEQLTLLYDDRPKQTFRIFKGKNNDSNYYIEKKDYYFVKGEACD